MSAVVAPRKPPPFDVVVLVTSAGGLDAVSAVLADLPAELGAAVVVGQHLGAESSLVEILARRTRLPVHWLEHGEALAPGEVHVVPPQMMLEVLPDRTCALRRVAGEVLRVKPLDTLLRSVADSVGNRALGVVLTGMGSDGAAGARALKLAGGAVLVQSESTASFPDMPRSAIEAGAADLVLPLGEIGRVIADVMVGGRFPHPRNEKEAREALFAGPGAARAALREVDWAATALGPVQQWPKSLQAVLAALLHSPVPMCVFWGDEFQQIYNDAWISVLGSKHPAAAGLPARITWAEQWPAAAADYRRVVDTGETQTIARYRVYTQRRGFREEAYFTSSRSPLADDGGTFRGLLDVLFEETEGVLAQRRLNTLRGLAAAGADQVNLACVKAATVLEENPFDVPFALFYLVDAAGLLATLAASAGLPKGAQAAPHTVDLFEPETIWPLGRVVRQGSGLQVDGLAAHLRGFAARELEEPPASALVLPLKTAGDTVGAVLIVAISPRLALDQTYREFLELAAQRIGANVNDARLRERERDRLEQLAELDRAKTEFFSNVSHEFRTPLTLILAPLEDLLAARGADMAPVRRELELAARNARRLLNLVDTLLDFSQIEAGRLHANFEPTDVGGLTGDIASLFRSAVERAGLRFDVACAPAPAPVRLDRGMWERIVSNLLSNALKYTFEGSISLRLDYLPQHVQLEVSDTGAGIPAEELPHVFRRFHRVRGTRARTEEGAGIGLATVDELVRLHHGRVRVRSVAGSGTTFTVWLPLQLQERRHAQAVAAPLVEGREVARMLAGDAERWSAPTGAVALPTGVVESMTGPAGRTLPAQGESARVLVVDDNADMREYLARILSGNWHVELAANGEEALERAREAKPDLILADVMMPMLDGFGLLRELRADTELKTTPVVLVTARAHEEAAIEGLLAGADDYVAKPFSSRELVARVGAQLELARVRRQGEREVRELLALVPVGVYAVDREGRFSYWNRHAVELWGRAPQKDDRDWALLGAPRALMRDGTWLMPQASPMAQVLRTGEPVTDEELTVLRRDGTVMETLVNIRPLRDSGTQVVGAVCAFLDITARRRAERSLKTLNDELEQRVEQRSRPPP